MSGIDVLIILVYFIVVIALGFYYSRKASKNLDAYFLGGKGIHWLGLAMSGSVSNFDITGTMWIVSLLYLVGMKSMWHHWMWGFLMGAFFMSYMGKWVRRSEVMTAAEWMKTRFGEDRPGRLARTAYALMAVLMLASFVGYAYQGIGKFASQYIPLEVWAESIDHPGLRDLLITHEASVLAILIIGITTFYVVMGGLHSVVVTDVVQTVILTVGSLFIAWIAWDRMTPEALAGLPEGWTSLALPWRISPGIASGSHAYLQGFGAMVIIWVIKGFLMNAGGPGQMYDFQRFLAARTPRDAAKVGAAWSLFLFVRWGMAVGIALLALTGVAGVTDAETVMPIVLQKFLPAGLRGIVIAGLLAAFMSTFSSTVNSAASFIVRDIWQPFFKPNATDRQAVHFSYIATFLVVIVGIAIGFQGESISRIWNWMMMALGAGVIIPNVLRWYWWRFNGWGYTLGTLGGIALSLVVLVKPGLPDYVTFSAITIASLAASVVGSLLTRPVENAVLRKFYRSVRPFGWWRPVREAAGLSAEQLAEKQESAGLTIVNVVVGMVAIGAFYLLPMYLVGHWYTYAAICAAVVGICIVILRFSWLAKLPESGPDSGRQ